MTNRIQSARPQQEPGIAPRTNLVDSAGPAALSNASMMEQASDGPEFQESGYLPQMLAEADRSSATQTMDGALQSIVTPGGSGVDGTSPGTALDGPGLTPPGERILGHQWVQSTELGAATAEETYDVTGTTRSWFNKQLANTVLGTDIDSSVEYPTRAIRFTYTTQDRGELVEATGVMVFPVVDDQTEMPVMLTLHGYGGMNNESAVSGGWDDGENATYQKLTSVVASSGKIVVVPDYIGLNSNGEAPDQTHPMLIAEPTAIASLDAVRAARNLLLELNQAETGGDAAYTQATAGETVAWGGSQGGHAAAAVARYQPSYAPDIPITAIGMGAPPLDVRSQLHMAVLEEKSVYHAAAMFSGMADWYGVPLNEVYKEPYNTLLPEIFAEGKGDDVEARLLELGLTMEQVLQPDVYQGALQRDFGGNPLWSGILGENSMPHSEAMPQSTIPGHLAIGGEDALVDPNVTRASFETLVEKNEALQFMECAGADHTEGAFLQTIDNSIAFLDDMLAGKELPIGLGQRLDPRDCTR